MTTYLEAALNAKGEDEALDDFLSTLDASGELWSLVREALDAVEAERERWRKVVLHLQADRAESYRALAALWELAGAYDPETGMPRGWGVDFMAEHHRVMNAAKAFVASEEDKCE